MILLRPVCARAAATAIRLASVPLLVKRTNSSAGKRAHKMAASFASFSPTEARLMPLAIT